jgi:hypothetical protein
LSSRVVLTLNQSTTQRLNQEAILSIGYRKPGTFMSIQACRVTNAQPCRVCWKL